MLQLTNICKAYKQPGNPQEVLKNVTLNLTEGEKMAIVGPSGSGKSTLLNIIGTLEKPDSGTIAFFGKDISTFSELELTQFRNQSIGFVFQMHHLFPQCNVLENVLIPTLTGKIDNTMKKRAEDLIHKVGLWEHRHKLPSRLSGGECQRVALARALINKPKLLLADEPTGSLDETNAQNLIDLLLELNQTEKVGLILVTHAEYFARKMDKCYRLGHGSLVPENIP